MENLSPNAWHHFVKYKLSSVMNRLKIYPVVPIGHGCLGISPKLVSWPAAVKTGAHLRDERRWNLYDWHETKA